MASQVSQSDLERRAAELAQRSAAAPAESWRPDKPEEGHPNPIIGVLLRVKAGGDRGYGPTTIAQLRAVDDTVWDVWLLGSLLEHEFDQHAEGTVRPGDMVAITYEGKRAKESGDGERVRRTRQLGGGRRRIASGPRNRLSDGRLRTLGFEPALAAPGPARAAGAAAQPAPDRVLLGRDPDRAAAGGGVPDPRPGP